MTQQLLAYLSSDHTESEVEALKELSDELAGVRPWTFGPPEFVDVIDESSCSSSEDLPLRTVGVVLRVAAPDETPQTPLAEPVAFLDRIAKFSAQRRVDFEVQLDETYVGDVNEGKLDELIREGLLARW